MTKSPPNNPYIGNLKAIVIDNEDWLMRRILQYAVRHGYSAYTSTLQEAWRLSISGLSASIVEALFAYDEIPDLKPEETLQNDPIALFGIAEAQRHRERGVSLSMFLGLMKYYRQSYIDLVRNEGLDSSLAGRYELFINRVFDRIEIGFCVEWSGSKGDEAIRELQINNRMMTNEKNKYLTIFESIPNPVIILNRSKKIDNMNLAAAKIFKETLAPGSQYYCMSRDRQLELGQTLDDEAGFDASCFGGEKLTERFPWLEEQLDDYINKNLESLVFEKKVAIDGQPLYFRIKISKSLDVSGKFDGIIIILEDITHLKQALEEVNTLRGFIPICAHCKNIRDDKGFWQKVENYVADHADVEFSHSICPECARKFYPDYNIS